MSLVCCCHKTATILRWVIHRTAIMLLDITSTRRFGQRLVKFCMWRKYKTAIEVFWGMYWWVLCHEVKNPPFMGGSKRALWLGSGRIRDKKQVGSTKLIKKNVISVYLFHTLSHCPPKITISPILWICNKNIYLNMQFD